MKTWLRFVLALAVCGSAALAQAAAITLRLVPSSVAVSTGEVVDVDAVVGGLGNPPSVGAFDLTVRFDPTLVSLRDVVFGPFLGDPLLFEALTDIEILPGVPESGFVNFAEVSLLSPADLDARQSSTFVLATLSFDAVADGIATFEFVGDRRVDDAFGAKFDIPEPSGALLAIVGLAGLAVRSVRRRRRLLLAPAALVAAAFVAAPAQAQTYRAGLVTGNDCYLNNVEHLRDALLKGSNWKKDNIADWTIRTVDGLKTNVISLLEKATDDDISVFYLCDHGSARPDADEDDPNNDSAKKKRDYKCTKECDERIGLVKDTLTDDELEGLFANVKGNKIFIFDACFSEGLQDGTKDFRPNTRNAIVMWACKTNETSIETNIWNRDEEKTGHDVFTGFLIAGLSDDGAGFARADANKDMMVTVEEWMSYAVPKTKARSPNQNAGFDDSREPADKKAGKKVVFKYAKGQLLKHPEATAGGRDRQRCEECGDECPEIDFFPYSTARLQIQTPFGTDDVVLRGESTAAVHLDSLQDADSNGREQVRTELLWMELTGTSRLLGPLIVRVRDAARHPFLRSTGEIEEAANNTPGTLDLPPFAPSGTAVSFFDVYFEIEALQAPPELQLLHNAAAKRMTATIAHKPPAEGDVYASETPTTLLDESNRPTPIAINMAFHTPEPKVCDYNGDGRIDRNDISGIFSLRGTAVVRGDPLDPDSSGAISVNSARICALRCDRPNCAL